MSVPTLSTRRVGWRPPAVAVAAALAAYGVARAQKEPAAPVAVGFAVAVVPDDQIDQMIFQQDRNAAGARQRLESLLTLHVDDLDRACQFTGAQKQKLQ